LKVEIPDEVVEEVERILSSHKFDWLKLRDVEEFVVDAVKRRVSEIIWGRGFERSRS